MNWAKGDIWYGTCAETKRASIININTYLRDIERYGDKSVEDDDSGEDLKEGEFSWVVLETVIVLGVDDKLCAVHTLEDEGPNQTDSHADEKERKDLQQGTTRDKSDC